jgi:hypothetical protein
MPIATLNVLVNPFKRGQSNILIPKGTQYRTTHPSADGIQETKRAATIKAHSVGDSYRISQYHGENDLQPPTVTIPGTGGYWKDFFITESLIAANGLTPEYTTIEVYEV